MMPTEQYAYQQLIEELIRRISREQLHQGDPLPSAAVLAKELSLSSNAIKGAIDHLNAMGILESENGRGSYLVGNASRGLMESLHLMMMLKHISPYEVCQMRRAMELAALPMAFEKTNPSDLDELKELLEQIQFGNVLESIHADEMSHMWIISASGNHLMNCVMQAIWGICSTQVNLLLSDGEEELHRQQAVVHERLYKSFVLHDLQMGLDAIELHYHTIEEAIKNAESKKSLTEL